MPAPLRPVSQDGARRVYSDGMFESVHVVHHQHAVDSVVLADVVGESSTVLVAQPPVGADEGEPSLGSREGKTAFGEADEEVGAPAHRGELAAVGVAHLVGTCSSRMAGGLLTTKWLRCLDGRPEGSRRSGSTRPIAAPQRRAIRRALFRHITPLPPRSARNRPFSDQTDDKSMARDTALTRQCALNPDPGSVVPSLPRRRIAHNWVCELNNTVDRFPEAVGQAATQAC